MRFVSRPRARNSRRPAHPGRLRRALRVAAFGAAAVLLLAAAAAGALAWRTGTVARMVARAESDAIAKSAEFGLTVRSVLVAGRDETRRADVLAALAVHSGQPLLAFHPAAAKARLEALGWVREASVARRFPGTISVRLVERRPIALWQHDGKFSLVDDTGTVIETADIARFATLPIVVGADAPRQTPALLAMLASEPALKARVTAAVRISGRRWNLKLDNGIKVRLPEERPEVAWTRLADLNRKYGILRRDVIAIDLRMSDRLLLQLSPSAIRRLHEPGADT